MYHAMKAYGGSAGIAPLDGSELSASRPDRFTARERTLGTDWIGGFVGPRAVLEALVKRKIRNPRHESNPRTPLIQPVAQRYTVVAIRAAAAIIIVVVLWKIFT
jgi:hypothetical protein